MGLLGEARNQGTSACLKSLVFVNLNELDEVWDKIKRDTEDGLLGGSSKAGTARPNPNATDPNTRVICVYTYDSDDISDIKRIREQLRKLGVTKKIPYKLDSDGRYRVKGDQKISKYYE